MKQGKKKPRLLPPEPCEFFSISSETTLDKVAQKSVSEWKNKVSSFKTDLAAIGVTTTHFILDHVENPLPEVDILKRESRLTQWARDNLFWAPNKNEKMVDIPGPTHTTYGAGGVLFVPYSRIPEAIQHTASDILEGRIFFYSEHRGPALKNEKVTMHLDMDAESAPDTPQTDTWAMMWAMILTCVQTVCSFFPDRTDIKCLVARSNPYIKVKDGVEFLHWGIHLYWRLIVDEGMWRMIREACLVRLEKEFGKRTSPSNAWSDLVDKNTITGSLRIIFARKPDRCPNTPVLAQKCSRCTLCHGKGIPGSKMYVPCVILTQCQVDTISTTTLHNWRKTKDRHAFWVKVVQMCSLRPYDAKFVRPQDIPVTEGFVVPLGLPLVSKAARLLRTKEAFPQTGTTVMGTQQQFFQCDPNSVVHGLIRALWKEPSFLQQLDSHHRALTFSCSDIFTTRNGNCLSLKSTCTYCINISGAHKKCRIYFVICQYKKKRSQVRSQPEPTFYASQHCGCKNHCVGYKSTLYTLPSSFSRNLFPKVFENKQVAPRSASSLLLKKAASQATSELYKAIATKEQKYQSQEQESQDSQEHQEQNSQEPKTAAPTSILAYKKQVLKRKQLS